MLEAINFYDYQKLGLMGWPLIVTSIVALALIFERSWAAVQFSRHMPHLQKALASEAQHAAETLSPEVRDQLMSLKLDRISVGCHRFISTLQMIAAIAPLMGLMGTILGIISTFKTISAISDPITPQLIADGLWEALLTTVIGLSIALPVLIFTHVYCTFVAGRIGHLTDTLNAQIYGFDRGGQSGRAHD